MRSFEFWVLFFVGVLAIISKSSSISDSTFTDNEVVVTMDNGGAAAGISNRKLKERSYDIGKPMKNSDLGSINQEDYLRFDPAPSSKASVSSGPIEHGTPLMPYVPPATPPTHPRHGSPP